MIGKFAYEDGKIIGQIHACEFRQACVFQDEQGRIVGEEARWIVLIEEYGTGQLVERFAEGLVIKLVSESDKAQ